MKIFTEQKPLLVTLAGTLAAFALPLLLLASSAYAQDDEFQLNASCTDVNDSSTCSFDDDAVVSEGLVNLAEDLFAAIDDQESANNLCNREGNIANCTINELDLICVIEDDAEGQPKTASCRINGGGLPETAFAVDCAQNPDDSGACSLRSSGEAIRDALGFIDNPQFKRVGENLLLGCVRRGGTEAFQKACDPVLAALSDGNEAGVLATLDAITPLNGDNVVDSSRFTLNSQLGHASQRLSRLRAGAEGVDLGGLQFFDGQQWLRAGDLLASTQTMMNDASTESWVSDDYGRLGFFIDGAIITSEQDGTLDENDAEADAQILTLGADYHFGEHFIGGLAFSAGFSSADYGSNRGELDTTSFLLMAYSSYYRGQWYVDATLALGGDSYEQQRQLSCDSSCAQAFNQTAEAEFNGNQIAFTLGTGYEWAIGSFSLAPYVQLASATLDVDGYRESMSNPDGAGAGFALDIGDQEKDLLTLSVGSQFRYVFSQDWGLIIPHLGLEYLTELEDDDSVVSGSFVGNIARDEEFTLTTNALDDSYFSISAGVSFQFRYSAAFIDIKSWQDNDEVDLLQFTVGWRWEL